MGEHSRPDDKKSAAERGPFSGTLEQVEMVSLNTGLCLVAGLAYFKAH